MPNTLEHIHIYPVGETAFTVEFGDVVEIALNRKVHALDAALRADPILGMLETVPTYRSLLVMYDPRIITAAAMLSTLKERADIQTQLTAAHSKRRIHIPVYYGGQWGPDLADVAAHCGLTPAQVIVMHHTATYHVAMLGFAPGFCYLLGLPAQLATPRLATPRLRVPAGSIGIAGAQTGMYALETPGGWRIIGRTDRTLFDPRAENPFTIQAGDEVTFEAVT